MGASSSSPKATSRTRTLPVMPNITNNGGNSGLASNLRRRAKANAFGTFNNVRKQLLHQLMSRKSPDLSASTKQNLNAAPLHHPTMLDHQLPPPEPGPTTHVRIRISCSDSFSGNLQRNDAFTQTASLTMNPRHSVDSSVSRMATSSTASSGIDVGGSMNSSMSSSTCSSISQSKAVVTRRTTIQASTGELLECLGQFVFNKFSNIVPGITNTTIISWMRSIDRCLLAQGWQDTPFISPGTVVFVYLLLRDSPLPHPSSRLCFLPQNVANEYALKMSDPSFQPTLYDLHCHINACLYIAYSYAGIEISYPQRPFNIVGHAPPMTPPTSTCDFWQRVLEVSLMLSEKMLRLNSDPLYFARTFAELKGQNECISSSCNTIPVCSTTVNTPPSTSMSSFNSAHQSPCSENINDEDQHHSNKRLYTSKQRTSTSQYQQQTTTGLLKCVNSSRCSQVKSSTRYREPYASLVI